MCRIPKYSGKSQKPGEISPPRRKPMRPPARGRGKGRPPESLWPSTVVRFACSPYIGRGSGESRCQRQGSVPCVPLLALHLRYIGLGSGEQGVPQGPWIPCFRVPCSSLPAPPHSSGAIRPRPESYPRLVPPKCPREATLSIQMHSRDRSGFLGRVISGEFLYHHGRVL